MEHGFIELSKNASVASFHGSERNIHIWRKFGASTALKIVVTGTLLLLHKIVTWEKGGALLASRTKLGK
jgi:hypothetical protein